MWAGILVALKAIPAIASIIGMIADLFTKMEERQIENHYNKKQRVRKRLLDELKTATGDRKREIIKKLSMLDSGADPDNIS